MIVTGLVCLRITSEFELPGDRWYRDVPGGGSRKLSQRVTASKLPSRRNVAVCRATSDEYTMPL